MDQLKCLCVLDHYRLSYYGQTDKHGIVTKFFNKEHNPQYQSSPVGHIFTKLVSDPNGLNLKPNNVAIDFAYPKLPQADSTGKNKTVSKNKVMQYHSSIAKDIVKYRPNVVLGFGNVANQTLFPTGSVTKNRGVPKRITYTYQGESYTVPTIVTFNLETAEITPYKYTFIKTDMHTANKVINIKHFHIGVDLNQYDYITNFNQVKQILTREVYNHAIVAVDTETNSLKPWNKGSKIIVFSLSWGTNQGVCIPFKHKQTPWNNTQLILITKWLKQLMMSKQYKVLHNGKYDIKFMMLTIGLPYARNCVDTLLMHYVGISEEQSISRGLKPLAIQYTSMGDYSAPLKRYKQQRAELHYQKFLKVYEANKISRKRHITKRKINKSDYKPLRNPIDGGDFNYEWIPLKLLAPYAAADTDATLRLYHVFRQYIIRNVKWIKLIYGFYPKLENSLSRMEANGMHIDMHQVDKLKPAYEDGIGRALKVIRHTPVVRQFEDAQMNKLEQYDAEMAKPKAMRNNKIIHTYRRLKGRQSDPLEKIRFNPNSTDHVKQVLFIYAGYQLPFDRDYMTSTAQNKRIKKSDWGNLRWYSAGKQSLQYCVKKYHSKFCKALLRYKKLYKLYDDFICKLPRMRDDQDCIHPKFIMSGTVTHRLASRDPNAQQIPARTANPKEFNYHYPVKSMITSRFKGGQIVNFDFKSFEVFVVTALCGEPNLVSALCNGYDAHKTNAARAFNVPYNKVTPDLRKKAKKVTFGCLYGISIPGLADQLHTDRKSAKKLYNRVLGALPVLHNYMNYVHAFVEKHYYVETLDGFRRRLKKITSSDYSARNRALRESLNAIVQGSTTYFIGMSIILIQSAYHKWHMRSKLICTVHDSIVADCPPEETGMATEIAIYIMQNLPIDALNRFRVKNFKDIPKKLWNKDGTFHFPFVSNAGVGNNYNDLVPYARKKLEYIKEPMYHTYFVLEYSKVCLNDYLEHNLINQHEYDTKTNLLNKTINKVCKKDS